MLVGGPEGVDHGERVDANSRAQQVDNFFFQLRIHLLVACSSDLSFFDAKASTLEEKEAAALSHVSKTIAFEATQNKAHPVRSLHQLQQALESLQAQLRAHANMRRPPPPALLTLMPPRTLHQQHLLWGFGTCVARDTSGQAGTSSFDKTLSGLKAVSFFESDLNLLHGQQPSGMVEAGQGPDFRGCLRIMQRCLELCLQLSNLEDVKWRSHLMCAALADTFLKQLPLPRPASQNLECVWATVAAEGDASPHVSYTLELLCRLVELLAFASGSGAVTGDDAAAWHSSLVCISGAIAAIADAVARSGAGTDNSTRLAELLCGKLGHLHGEADASVGGAGAGEGRYSVGMGAFEARTSTLLLTPELCLVRKHVLEYFHGLQVDEGNELFAVEENSHYANKKCATRRFFSALSQNIYSRTGAAQGICDVGKDMLHASNGLTAFRDVRATSATSNFSTAKAVRVGPAAPLIRVDHPARHTDHDVHADLYAHVRRIGALRVRAVQDPKGLQSRLPGRHGAEGGDTPLPSGLEGRRRFPNVSLHRLADPNPHVDADRNRPDIPHAAS